MIAFFISAIIILIVVIIICFLILKKLSRQENEYMEVSNNYLKNIGKDYTKDQFASSVFQFYNQIILSVGQENYNYLRDVLADDLYNNYLISIKNAKDRNVKNVVEDIKPIFTKLVSLVIKGDLEIAKVWIKMSYIEYSISTNTVDESNNLGQVVSGSKNHHLEKEYMLTLVKSRTDKESVACPNCGYITHIILQSNCNRCGAIIVNRNYHWVLVGKEEIKINH